MKIIDENEAKLIRCDERIIGASYYTYSLRMTEGRARGGFRIPTYTVEVKMIDEDGDESFASTDEVFFDAGEALLFYEKVVRNLATPINLAYVLEDETK